VAVFVNVPIGVRRFIVAFRPWLLGKEEMEFDAEETEDMRKNDIRKCTRDLLLVERAREWLLESREK
jgi:hypothetical protein